MNGHELTAVARPRTVSDEEILDAAVRVVAREGPLRFTLADVGAEVGLTASALLKRFGTKRALLLAVSASSGEAIASNFADARAASAGPTEALARALAAQSEQMGTPREIANGLAFLQLDITEKDFRAHALAFFDAFHEEVVKLLDEAVAKKELRADDTAALARAIEVAFNGSVVRWGVRQDGAAVDALAQDVEAVLAPFRTRRRGPAAALPRAIRPARAEGRASRGT